jgi:hypothetical protein
LERNLLNISLAAKTKTYSLGSLLEPEAFLIQIIAFTEQPGSCCGKSSRPQTGPELQPTSLNFLRVYISRICSSLSLR